MQLRRWRTLACLAILTFVPGLWLSASPVHGARPAAGAVSGLHVIGNRIVNGAGQTVRLLGVDRSGAEFACIQGWGIFDGPVDNASILVMASWHINAVRVPLNEDCWLGINGAAPAYSGANYRSAITAFVQRLNQNGLAVILDLHWNAPGSAKATGQQPMPDRDHAPAFWSSVAKAFKSNLSVIFDLYNEPYPDSNLDTSAAWSCWKSGGTCAGVPFQAAGMQELVSAVRNAGAKNVIMLGGVEYSNSLSGWLSHEPYDAAHGLAASWHSYNFNYCSNQACWNSTVAPVLSKVPVIAGEIGESDCAHGYIDTLMPWLDAHGASYLAWTWNTWNCSGGPALISSYNGTPTTYGVGYKNHLALLRPGPR